MKNRHELREEFAKHGIDFVYNDRSRSCYLKIKGAPVCVEGQRDPSVGAQLTGWYHFPGGIKDAQNVPALAQRAKELYRERFADNPHMLKYLEQAETTAAYKDMFIFDHELCVEDEKHECIDGYLWATDGLVDRLKEQLHSQHSAEELDSLENINFYCIYNMVTDALDLTSTYWYMTEADGTFTDHHGTHQLPLSDEDAKALKASMELYCERSYNMNCLSFLNEARAHGSLPAITYPKEIPTVKPSLASQIQAAMSQLPEKAPESSPSHDAPGR